MGCELFQKSGNGLQLTAYGTAIYPICRDMVRNFEASLQKIRAIAPDGASPIRLTTAYQAAETLSFTLIEDFLRDHPGVSIHCDSMPDLPAEKAVLDGEADFVLGIGSPQPQNQFDSRLIRPLSLVHHGRTRAPLYGRETLRMADLNELTLHCAAPSLKPTTCCAKRPPLPALCCTSFPPVGTFTPPTKTCLPGAGHHWHLRQPGRTGTGGRAPDSL